MEAAPSSSLTLPDVNEAVYVGNTALGKKNPKFTYIVIINSNRAGPGLYMHASGCLVLSPSCNDGHFHQVQHGRLHTDKL